MKTNKSIYKSQTQQRLPGKGYVLDMKIAKILISVQCIRRTTSIAQTDLISFDTERVKSILVYTGK